MDTKSVWRECTYHIGDGCDRYMLYQYVLEFSLIPLLTRIRPQVMSGASTLPVHAGGTSVRCLISNPLFIRSCAEIQYKSLGMKTEIFDPDGKSIEDTGTPGELVITRPHPSFPLCFWGDKNDEKLRDAYFNFYPGRVSCRAVLLF